MRELSNILKASLRRTDYYNAQCDFQRADDELKTCQIPYLKQFNKLEIAYRDAGVPLLIWREKYTAIPLRVEIKGL